MDESIRWINKASGFLPAPRNTDFIVHQYQKNSLEDNELHMLSVTELFTYPNYADYYYRLDPFNRCPRGKKSVEHFGVMVSNEGSNSFDMGIYSNQFLNYLLSFCETPQELLRYMNLNLKFHYEKIEALSLLDHDSFDKELSSFLSSVQFFGEIYDLSEVKDCSGLYLMVLDDYASCYIGQSKNIKTRIQQHWKKMNYGTIGIDMFKALDTTRIYVLCTSREVTQHMIDKLEYMFIHTIDSKYLLNQLGGGSSIESIHSGSHVIGYGCDPV